ncbi:aluminum-activated malate transporter 2-like [Camellia sinensis]|uniref:aluminum-activated malate transporter 2-like n=1 Tax=Camellia sinensis TaxID=4442 RepID=UPI001036DC5F|nr:aluminum-activated malate transporter 2-like [Camellia sinensis]
MEIGSENYVKTPLFSRSWRWLKTLPEKLKAEVVKIARNTKKIGQDDPRRVIHSFKVGLALTLVSLLYYFQPVYNSFGISAMWAVMTVVVVFEFSVGATLGKGINRGLATLVAGGLGVGAHHLASISGKIGEPILIGLFVFLLAAAATFIRFFPKVKARYDYGLLIFILTFSLVCVSGFRNNEILELAHQRLSTVLIGATACVIVSIFVCPVWAGQDLHNLVSLNLETLGSFLEGFGDEYFRTSESEDGKDDKSFLQAYKNVLNSKTSEETLANFAKWEPRHGHFMYCHPWNQYLKIGTLTRQCAYRIEALNGHLNSKTQVMPKISEHFQEICIKMSLESGKALKDLALAIKTMTEPCSVDPHIKNSKTASKRFQSLLELDLWEDLNLLEVIPVATVASLLSDIVVCTEKIAELVHELATLAHFESVDFKETQEKSKVNQCGRLDHIAVTADGSSQLVKV